MIMTDAAVAFDRAIRDAEELLTLFDKVNADSDRQNGEVLKRAGVVMALVAWETYIKDRIREEFDLRIQCVEGSSIGKFVRKRLEEDLKRFFNPNSQRIRQIFVEHFEVDITKKWVWDNYDCHDAQKRLDALVSKRCMAAHQANGSEHKSAEPDQIKREELEKGIRFLKGLVAATEKIKLT